LVFVTENFGFFAIKKIFYCSIALATLLKKSKFRVQNVGFAGKRKTRSKFITFE